MIRIYCHGNLCAAYLIVGTDTARCTCCGALVQVVRP